MKIVVTGSRGTIGRLLMRELKRRGHVVYGIDVMHTDEPHTEYARCDIRSMMQVERILRTQMPDVVYHLAAEFGRNNGEDFYDTLWGTNAVGTKHILVLQRKLRFKLVFASSSEVYGELPEGVPYAEGTTDTHPLHHYNDYAMSKWVNEQQIRNDAERYGTESMVLRFFNAYGPGERYHDYRSVVALFIYRMLKGMPITAYADYHRVFMYIGDMIPTLANAVERFRAGSTYNVGGEDYRSVRELVALLQQLIPESTSEILWESAEAMNVSNKRPDNTLARRDLGHNPTVGLESGLRITVPWYRNEYT